MAEMARDKRKSLQKKKKKKRRWGWGRGEFKRRSNQNSKTGLCLRVSFHAQWPRARLSMTTYARKRSESPGHQVRSIKIETLKANKGQQVSVCLEQNE